MPVKITLDTSDHHRLAVKLEERFKRPVQLLKRIHVYILGKTGLMFRKNRRGGTYRGVYWPPFAPQYTRKTDGVTVPAEGGVRKVYGSGTVKGRKRPSGKRITQSSNLMRDTGGLAQAAGATRRINLKAVGGASMEGVTTGKQYAAEQQDLRPFLFFQLPEDARAIHRFVIRHIEGRL